ncbi:DNA-processing protein DprA [Spongisporangium articulatum]|uniref:DNA-processing protein DprA n=1 Tax=Spongisporangium articulatum TaxID=3362603 RepID=A0ABW8AP30_9ACTN
MSGGLLEGVPGPASVRFDVDDERLARAAWSRLAEPGDLPARQLVQEFGASAALRGLLRGQGPPRWRSRLSDLDPVRDVRALERVGARFVVPSDPEWPGEPLSRLGVEQPFGLWVRGPLDLGEACERAIAVVGSRNCTAYGERVALELAADCARDGVTVVSGGAYGIDGAAHRGALQVAGRTVTVLACGVDRIYPTGHDQLFDRIRQVGAVVSEVPPGSSPTRWRFVERNRLIACLSRLAVVVEATDRSGASSTAARAAKHGVPVGAVPGPVYSPTSYGPHQLLRTGAVCITSAGDALDEIQRLGEAPSRPAPPRRRAAHDDLPPADLRVFDALPVRTTAPVASLAKVAGLDESTVLAALGRLELRNLAVRSGAGWRRART